MGISDANSGKLYLFLGVTATISRPASGLLCQLKGVKDWLVTAASNIFAAIIFLVMQYFTSYGLMVLFVVLFGLFDGLFMAGINIMAMSCFANPEKRSSCFGTIMMCASIFLACAPPIAGELLRNENMLNIIVVITIIIIIIMIIFITIIVIIIMIIFLLSS